MIKLKKQINLAESLSPWDVEKQLYQTKNHEQLTNKKQKIKNKSLNDRLEASRTKILASNKSVSRRVIKLQPRVPTETLVFTQRKQEQKVAKAQPEKNQMLFKLPERFKAIPSKRLSDKGLKSTARSHRQLPISQQKASFRNFKQQIEQLNKLNKFYKSQEKRNHSSVAKNNKIDYEIVKKCSLLNVRMFEEEKNGGQNSLVKLKKVMTQSKKHVLDKILSRFQF